MLKVLTDVRFSRRKRIHCVADERDQILWTGPVLDAALKFCLDSGHLRVRVEGDHHAFVIEIREINRMDPGDQLHLVLRD